MARTRTLDKAVRILTPESWTNDTKGKYLEDISAQILRRQSYEVTERIRFSGMEIDLLGIHRPSGDSVYVECKFQGRPLSANVLDLMVGQGFRRKISRLALFSASPLSSEAKGTHQELVEDDRISFSFYGPGQIIEAMVDATLAPVLPDDLPTTISHATLLVHPEHQYLWLLQEQHDGRPTGIALVAREQHKSSPDDVRSLLDHHGILDGLPVSWLESRRSGPSGMADGAMKEDRPAEVVSRVAVADNLIDYRPCRPSDFVGRTELQKQIWNYLGDVRDGRSSTRLVALVEASGFGKSSLVAKLAERFKNQKWRTKYFLFPVDVRSARGPLFVAEALLQGIREAADASFIELPGDLQVENAENVLAGDSISAVLEQLRSQSKVLVLFFDQFEEVFTKNELSGYPLYSRGEPSYPWTRAVGGEDRGN